MSINNNKELNKIRKAFENNVDVFLKDCKNNSQGIEQKLKQVGFNPQTIFSIDDDSNWLGCYQPMKSPGKIYFNFNSLTQFYWYVYLKMSKGGTKPVNQKVLKKRIFNKTLYHELFHYYSDFMRNITNSKFNHLEEEALAVACAYRSASNHTNLMPGPELSLFYDIAYAYTSPGYKDYKKHVGSFYPDIVSYLNHEGFLKQEGIPETLFLALINKPNVEFIIK